ncbi:hypothetical protein D3C73_1086330 [compost metagenome]
MHIILRDDFQAILFFEPRTNRQTHKSFNITNANDALMHNAWNTDSDSFDISILINKLSDLIVDNIIMNILDQPAFLLNDLTNQISDSVR